MLKFVVATVAVVLTAATPFASQARADDAAIARLAAEHGDDYARVCRVKVTRIYRGGQTIVRRVRSCSGGDDMRVRRVIRGEREVRGGGEVRVRGGGGGTDIRVRTGGDSR